MRRFFWGGMRDRLVACIILSFTVFAGTDLYGLYLFFYQVGFFCRICVNITECWERLEDLRVRELLGKSSLVLDW